MSRPVTAACPVDATHLAACVAALGGEQARAVEVQERRELALREGVDDAREAPRDVVVAEPPADRVRVLPLDQRVVVRAPRPRLGELPDMQPAE